MAGVALFSSDSKRGLLHLIKQSGSLTVDEARDRSGLTRTTLREHFGDLEREGLICRASVRHGRGRPTIRYSLTEAGQSLFPTRDGVLLRDLIRFLQEGGHTHLIEQFFTTFWENRLSEARQRLAELPAGDLESRMRGLEDLLREQGFMPDIHRVEENIVVRECNCPFPEAIKQTRMPCQLEARFLEGVLELLPVRTSYIPDGMPACTYEFAEPDTSQP